MGQPVRAHKLNEVDVINDGITGIRAGAGHSAEINSGDFYSGKSVFLKAHIGSKDLIIVWFIILQHPLEHYPQNQDDKGQPFGLIQLRIYFHRHVQLVHVSR